MSDVRTFPLSTCFSSFHYLLIYGKRKIKLITTVEKIPLKKSTVAECRIISSLYGLNNI